MSEQPQVSDQIETGTQAPIRRRRKKSPRLYCGECRKVVKSGGEFVTEKRDGEERVLHVYCAGFISSPAVAPCPECFCMPPCGCMGS